MKGTADIPVFNDTLASFRNIQTGEYVSRNLAKKKSTASITHRMSWEDWSASHKYNTSETVCKSSI